jgi:hypothetical protein
MPAECYLLSVAHLGPPWTGSFKFVIRRGFPDRRSVRQ